MSAYSVLQTDDGGYILGGCYEPSWMDLILFKTDQYGNEEWYQSYGDPNTDEQGGVVEKTDDGGYIIVGFSGTWSSGYDIYLVKTSADGIEEWNMTYGGDESEMALSVIQANDGGYLIAGGTSSYGNGQSDFWLIKTFANGMIEWTQTYGGYGAEWSTSAQKTADGGYIISGYTTSYGAGSHDFWVVKIDSDGNEDWHRTYGGPQQDIAYAVKQTSDQGYIISGMTESYGNGGFDYWIVKTDENGNEEWNQTYGGSGDDDSCSIIQTGDDGFFIAGTLESFGYDQQYIWLIRTGAETSINNCEIISKIELNQNYPNPFNPNTVISYQLVEESPVAISIFNIRGQKLKQLLNDHQSSGRHSIIWDGSDDFGKPVSSGIYFYELKAKNFVMSRKMILLR